MDLAITAEGKFKVYTTKDKTDRFTHSMLNKKTEIENVAEGITKLAQNFEKEYQSYMQILSNALDKIGQ